MIKVGIIGCGTIAGNGNLSRSLTHGGVYSDIRPFKIECCFDLNKKKNLKNLQKDIIVKFLIIF